MQSASSSSSRRKNSSPYLKHLPYRANLQAAIKYIPTIPLRKPHIDLLKETPFWLLIHVLKEKSLKPEECRKVDISLEMILRQYKGNEEFLIGSKLVELRASDIQLIFGIICGNKKVSGLSCSKNKVKFAKRKDLQRLDNQGIKNLISDELLKSNKKQDVQDDAQLVCLFLCATLFFTSSATLSMVYVKHMDDWNEMKNYDWGTAIKDMLIRSIEKNISDPWKVQGCAILLLYWFCEHTKIMQPKIELAVPRFLKWDISRLHLKNYQIGSIADEQVNEDELSTTSQEDLSYKMQIEQEKIGKEQEEGEEGEDKEEEQEQEEEEEEEEEEIYIEEEEEEQNEIEQEVIFIEDEEDEEEQEGHEKEEQVKEEEDDENKDEEEGDAAAVEQDEGDSAAVEQVAEEVDAVAVDQDEGDSAEEGDSVQKLAEEVGVQNGNDSEMDDMFHTAEAVDEQLKSTTQSASTFVPETQFSNQARDHTAVEDDVDLGERQTQAKKTIDELEEGLRTMQDELEEEVRNLQHNCAKLEEDNVIHEAQIRVLEVLNSELEKHTLLLRLELNEECQHRKKVEYEKSKMTREKDAEIALLKQRIKQLTHEKNRY